MIFRDKNEAHGHARIKIAVSGAADTAHCGEEALDKAKKVGRAIARNGAVLVSGATTGFPLWASIGMKEEGGISIGLSPAASEREHVEAYRLPIDYMDLLIYTGFGYAGRDLLLTRSSDAIIIGCGRVGTIHEFTVAFEDGKPIGILEGGWTTDDTIKDIIARANRTRDNIIFESDPNVLVEKLIALVKKEKVTDTMTYSYRPLEE
ncbi:MAG: hypothetical protein AAB805_02355 [Patescibacteria group bacterium]